jgi:hypothetical protein
MNDQEKKEAIIPGIPGKKEEVKEITPARRLVVETDGNKIRIVENTLSGLLETKAVLTELLTSLR